MELTGEGLAAEALDVIVVVIHRGERAPPVQVQQAREDLPNGRDVVRGGDEARRVLADELRGRALAGHPEDDLPRLHVLEDLAGERGAAAMIGELE